MIFLMYRTYDNLDFVFGIAEFMYAMKIYVPGCLNHYLDSPNCMHTSYNVNMEDVGVVTQIYSKENETEHTLDFRKYSKNMIFLIYRTYDIWI